jgi:SAM-dependent methyltransferase
MRSQDWDRKHARRALLWTDAPSALLVDQVAGLAPGRALDLACGAGRNAVWLAARGWRVTGVDFSPVALTRAAGLAADRAVEVTWVPADLLTYRPEPGGADLVVIAYLQLPAAQRRVVLAGAAAALAPGGTLLVIGHDLANLTEGAGGPTDPDVLLTPDAVLADVPGLRPVLARRVTRPAPAPPETPVLDGTEHDHPAAGHDGRPRSAVDTLVRAVRPAG